MEDTLEWYHSQLRDRLYRQHDGKVETFAPNQDGGYYVTKLSMTPRDVKAALITPGRAHGTHDIKKQLDVPIDIWCKVTSQQEIEQEIIARN